LLCAARSSSRLASCLSSHSRASAAALRQVGLCPLRRGNRALRSMVAIDRNSRKFLACAEKRPALRAFSNVPYVRNTWAAPAAPSPATPGSPPPPPPPAPPGRLGEGPPHHAKNPEPGRGPTQERRRPSAGPLRALPPAQRKKTVGVGGGGGWIVAGPPLAPRTAPPRR